MSVTATLPPAYAFYAGLAGGGCVVLAQFVQVHDHNRWPWADSNVKLYLATAIARLLLGGGAAGGLALTGQISGLGGAFVVGVGAPVIIARLLANVGGSNEVVPTRAQRANGKSATLNIDNDIVDRLSGRADDESSTSR